MPLGPMPPKGSVLLGEVVDGVVDGGAAGDGALQHLLDARPVAVEVVERQRPRPGVHVGDRLVEGVVGHDRQQRPEDLLLHDAHGIADAGEDDGSDLARVRRADLAVRQLGCRIDDHGAAPLARASLTRPARRS